MIRFDYFASCPKGLENLLFQELQHLGVESVRETLAGVHFSGPSEIAYKICLWSRLANKVLLALSSIELVDETSLYEGVRRIDWSQHLSTDNTFRVDFVGTDQTIRNSQFGALRVKDAIADYFRDNYEQRPFVERDSPDLIVDARLYKGKLQLSLNLSGDSLHRRAYRQRQGEAPIKENLASAMLLRSGWPELAERGGYLLDPMCGSATLLIEGTMMAADIAPGFWRRPQDWGFSRWLQFDSATWQHWFDEATVRKEAGLVALRDRGFEARGYDNDWRALEAAEANIQQSGLSEFIQVQNQSIAELTRPTHKTMNSGLLISNPPYGERLGEEKTLLPIYRQLGDKLRQEFTGWHSAIISSNPELLKAIGISHQKKYQLWNGRIPAELRIYTVEPEYFHRYLSDHSAHSPTLLSPEDLSRGASMVYNRMRKNQKQLRRWLEREAITCYRLYDADLPEYAAAVDIYGEAIHVQEYAAPKSIDRDKAAARFRDLCDGLSAFFSIDRRDLYLKQRRRHKGKQQYTAMNPVPLDAEDKYYQPHYLTVREDKAEFLVDLSSYLDTGLFLDHRPLRKRISQQAGGKKFLNLFCYTATATVHAALGGAASSVSVDMSKTYLKWAERNLQKNHINTQRHQLVRENCLQWLQQCREGFDLILLDPPSFSNSKRMEGTLDIQRDHVGLIRRCVELLLPGGLLWFSTNLRTFTLDQVALADYQLKNITKETLGPDFQRNAKIHQCWEISRV
jgi:23S rRNA (guanine2445-N2)-methyltransferase / 23S rRNA (guanine2069-N7)-methyltransferase